MASSRFAGWARVFSADGPERSSDSPPLLLALLLGLGAAAAGGYTGPAHRRLVAMVPERERVTV